jgi:hypothetical protein
MKLLQVVDGARCCTKNTYGCSLKEALGCVLTWQVVQRTSLHVLGVSVDLSVVGWLRDSPFNRTCARPYGIFDCLASETSAKLLHGVLDTLLLPVGKDECSA